MRTTTRWALTVAAGLAAVTGAAAQDAATTAPVLRADAVLAAGDRVHGYLRGGETHALRVHLARGESYSFSAATTSASDPLVMRLSFRDSSGREINWQAHVRHLFQGKRIVLGPYRVPKTGTYTIELSGDGLYANGGDYVGTSKIRAVRTSHTLPKNGTMADVDVVAGATLRLHANGGLVSLAMAMPGDAPNRYKVTDPLVVSLRSVGLSSSDTGTYRFAAEGGRAVSVDVQRPRWKPNDVAVATLAELPPGLVPADFALPAAPEVDVSVKPPSTSTTSTVGEMIPVTLAATGSSDPTTLFVGANIDSAGGTVADHFHAMPTTSDGSVAVAPTPPSPVNVPADSPTVRTSSAPQTGQPPALPEFVCSNLIGNAAFVKEGVVSKADPGVTGNTGVSNYSGWLYTHWARSESSEATSLLSFDGFTKGTRRGPAPEVVEYGDSSDPFVRRTIQVFDWFATASHVYEGEVTTTTRYFVDGHQVSSLLATGGDVRIEWTVEGAGTADDGGWKLDGSWRMTLRGVDDPALVAKSMKSPKCSLDGSERLVVGTAQESIAASDLSLVPANHGFAFDITGVMTNTVSIPDAGFAEKVVREMLPVHTSDDPLLLSYSSNWKSMSVTTTTTDATVESTDAWVDQEDVDSMGAWVDQENFAYFGC